MLLDLLLGFAADAAVTGAQSRRVPKVLRIVLAMLIALFMLTLGGFMLLCAVAIDGGMAALCLGYLVFFIRAVWRKMR